jgi:FkbM family methyltransferase
LKKNVESNPIVRELVELSDSAVSDENSEISFQENSNPEILSSIIFTGSNHATSKVIVNNLVDEIKRFNSKPSRKLVIKMDIEGAEWKILRNNNVLRAMKEHEATLLLAVHPGFAHPMPTLAKKHLIARIPWLIKQTREAVMLHENLSKFGSIKRTNLNNIENKFKFALLIIAGYHEFIINFF